MFFTTEYPGITGYVFYSGAPNVVMSITGGGALTTSGGVNCTTLTASSNATILGTLNVTGALTTSSFYANKPWVGVKYTAELCVSSLLEKSCYLVLGF